jgi:hypothetical protein
MIESDAKQRTLIADKLFDAANVAAGGMVFGQFLAERPFSTDLAIFGHDNTSATAFHTSAAIIFGSRAASSLTQPAEALTWRR